MVHTTPLNIPSVYVDTQRILRSSRRCVNYALTCPSIVRTIFEIMARHTEWRQTHRREVLLKHVRVFPPEFEYQKYVTNRIK
jgi:hypothetical protein